MLTDKIGREGQGKEEMEMMVQGLGLGEIQVGILEYGWMVGWGETKAGSSSMMSGY